MSAKVEVTDLLILAAARPHRSGGDWYVEVNQGWHTIRRLRASDASQSPDLWVDRSGAHTWTRGTGAFSTRVHVRTGTGVFVQGRSQKTDFAGSSKI